MSVVFPFDPLATQIFDEGGPFEVSDREKSVIANVMLVDVKPPPCCPRANTAIVFEEGVQPAPTVSESVEVPLLCCGFAWIIRRVDGLKEAATHEGNPETIDSVT